METATEDISLQLRDLISKAAPLLLVITDVAAAVKPAPAKWSQKEILGHLIDSASNNHHKIVRLVQQETLSFPGYDQDAWVSVQNYNDRPWKELVELWRAFNSHLAFVIASVPDAALEHRISIGGEEPVPLSFVIKDYLRHLRHHLFNLVSESGI